MLREVPCLYQQTNLDGMASIVDPAYEKINNGLEVDDNPIIGRSVQSCHDVNSKINGIRLKCSMQKIDLEG